MTDQTKVDQDQGTNGADTTKTEPVITVEEFNALKAENAKLLAIKNKMVEEQNAKNKKHRELLNGADSLKESLLELQTNHEQLLEKFNKRDSFFVQENARKKAALEAKLSMISDDKKALLPDYESIPDESERTQKTLDYIDRNSQYLLGKPSLVQTTFPTHKPAVKTENEIKLTPDEALIAERGNISLSAALELKRRDNDYFLKFLKK